MAAEADAVPPDAQSPVPHARDTPLPPGHPPVATVPPSSLRPPSGEHCLFFRTSQDSPRDWQPARARGPLAPTPPHDPGSAEAEVARAMAAFPEMVGGTGRDATLAMRAVPGLVAKDGADGVYGAGLPDGRALALKVLDGASRPRPAVLAAALRRLGALDVAGADASGLDALGDVPVLGAGQPVGAVRAVLDEPGTDAAHDAPPCLSSAAARRADGGRP